MKNKIRIISVVIFLPVLIILISFGGQKADDVVVVSNPKTPELNMRIVFNEELSIGEVEGDENYMFGNQVYFNTDDEGNFYVNDWDRRRIQKYDSQGKYLCAIGKKGQGPGEFQNVWTPRFDKDNNLYVSDYVSRRISFFDKEGKFLRQIKIPIRSMDIYINTKGFYVGRQSTLIEGQRGIKYITIYGLFDDKFKLTAEIHKETWEPKPPSGRDENSIAQGLANTLSDMAFNPQITYFLTEDDSIYFGYPKKYEIHIYTPEGKLSKIIRREYEPIKVSKWHKENYIKNQAEDFLRNLPLRADSIKKKAIQLIKYPKYKPAYQRFTLMENGWLIVIIDTLEDGEKLIDVFDQEGKYIAQFKTAVSTNRLFFKNGKAYALAIENDYRFVKRNNFEIQEYKDNRWVRKNN